MAFTTTTVPQAVAQRTTSPPARQHTENNSKNNAIDSSETITKCVVLPLELPTLKRPSQGPLLFSNKPTKQPRLLPIKKRQTTNDPEERKPPTRLQLMWRYCQGHRPELLPSFRTALDACRNSSNCVMKSAVLERLVTTWGGPTLAQVYRQVKGVDCQATGPTVQAPFACLDLFYSGSSKKRTNVNACVDLTGDDYDADKDDCDTVSEQVGNRQSVDLSGDEGDDSEQDDVANTRPGTGEICSQDEEVQDNVGNDTMDTGHCYNHDEMAPLETLAAAAVAKSRGISNKMDPDQIELGIAYGFNLAQRHDYHTKSLPSRALWEEAALQIRFMSPRDRQRVWNRLFQQQKGEQEGSF